FGGMNVIFAGDFAQLPPAVALSLYSNKVSLRQVPRASQYELRCTLGKGLWHQVTTVVILTQNMRQQTASDDDNKLRQMLENLRYRACTDGDLDFIRSRMPCYNDALDISSPEFRYCPIITGRNAYRDQFNTTKAVQFAKDHGLTLYEFHSIDRRKMLHPDSRNSRRRKFVQRPFRKQDQDVVWKQPPAASQHVPGVLQVCVGMPVIIRRNDATELSITKGQEGVVVGWKDSVHPFDPTKVVLDVLFVRLSSPKAHVKFEGLPQSVVPLTRLNSEVTVKLPAQNSSVTLQREQISVILNFALTDFGSQGKTR
ncbi:hypothetical protein BKA70DRAFT_1076522, partial [Coprinopsis sp. MPI-PUGE-AT-0042]